MPTLTKTLYNKYNAPKKEKVPHGDPIYKYSYRDKKTGEMKENTINMQEKIQSYLSQVDYKKRIEMGLGLEAPLIQNGNNVADFTQLPDNSVDLVRLVDALGSLSQDQIANIIQQSSSTVQTAPETGQTTVQSTSITGEETSASSATDSTTTGTGGE